MLSKSETVHICQLLIIRCTRIKQGNIEEHSFEEKNRDVNDRPILRAAIHAKADILLIGDKDFLESGLQNPKIMTAADFILMN